MLTSPPVAAAAPLVSFAGLFGLHFEQLTISSIEIPLIQRDYAQGRNSVAVSRIRDAFVTPLCAALVPGAPPVDLDFIFGDVGERGQFMPLDGQQRLTTLFLLHCYLAWRTSVPGREQSWSHFTYETRGTAREFCAFLVRERPAFPVKISDWIRDHANYLSTWDFDPTIASMLTMLDALHDKITALGIADFRAAMQRLLDPVNPAIRFYVLPVADSGLTDELYIKMNSRGKPLSDFENFKAHFEGILTEAGHPDPQVFARQVDTPWSDILWQFCRASRLVDDAFLRYIRCITEINAWNAGIEFKSAIRTDDLAQLVYGCGAPKAAASLAFLFAAFNAWSECDTDNEFATIFVPRGSAIAGKVPLFKTFDKEGVNLFVACCRWHGTAEWPLARTLLLYGVLVEKIKPVALARFNKRMRMLRNLIEASVDEIRVGERNTMPRLLADVRVLIKNEDLAALSAFNRLQIDNEIAKLAMLSNAPALEADMHALEDHDLLRGGLTSFQLDPASFAARAHAFLQLFDKSPDDAQPYLEITGALLAQGDYSRPYSRSSGYWLRDFGAARNDEPWRDIFRGKKHETRQPLKAPLASILDALAGGISLAHLQQRYLTESATAMDWRYYFVKYDVMRSGASGRYIVSPGAGYQACMLNKEKLTSNYYDPYLRAIVLESGVQRERIGNLTWPFFTGPETLHRALVLKDRQIRLRSVNEGWAVETPSEAPQEQIVSAICAKHGLDPVGTHWILRVPQIDGVDTRDRIQVGAALLRALVGQGGNSEVHLADVATGVQ